MASSSSSSSIIRQPKYDVFLSFRGEDTRDNFTSHLYAALCRKKIQTFIDDVGLERGDDISPALLEAIEGSRIAVVIFSKQYASSKWCLDELVKILECKKINEQMLIPVFYQVNPSEVRKHTGSFEEAFVKHGKRFKDMRKRVQQWRDALTEAANLSGWDSTVIRPKSKLVEEIVGDILKKLNAISAPSDCEGLVGIDSKVEHIKSLLCIGSLDFRIIGIWGMGGIGKTTIAEVVFNQIRGQFEGCCFIRNVREELAKTTNGLVRLKEQILSQILQEENLNIGTLNAIPTSIKRRIQQKKIFIVLDDESKLEQLKILTRGIDRFGLGSRVIVTTRDKQVLCNYEEDNIYEVKGLNYHQAFQLFSNYAFNQYPPLDELLLLSEKIIDHAKGNPLALKVLGSSLCRKDKRDWESALHKLHKLSNLEIHNVLKTSYDALDCEEQNIFLDISCFFKGEDRDHTIKILDGCYHSVSFGLSILIDKTLITISDENKLEMHDLLQEMGWEIVCQENLKDPGKRSRLWYHEDVYRVLRDNKGTDSVEGIFLNMSKIQDIKLSSGAFAKMSNLKLLKFYTYQFYKTNVSISKVHLPQGLKCLPNELRYFHWDGYPLKALPSKFTLENLVQLNMPYSKVEQIWEGRKNLPNLKFIDLSDSQYLRAIPDLSDAIELEIINLDYCTSLVDVSLSVQGPGPNKIRFLHLSSCTSLRSFSSNIPFKCLQYLDLSDCINLKKFPKISGTIEHLNLSWTGIEEVPSYVQDLNKLRKLELPYCDSLKSFASNIHFKSLQYLDLSDCINLKKFPQILGTIEQLNLSRTGIEEVPTSVQDLTKLHTLDLNGCESLRGFLSNIHFRSLEFLNLTGCINLTKFPPISGNIVNLCMNETAIEEVPSSIACLTKLLRLDLQKCRRLKSLPTSICKLKSLNWINLSDCSKLESFPEILEEMESLGFLELKGATIIKDLPSSIENLKGLFYLGLKYCKNLETLPSSISNLTSLSEIYVCGCSKLDKLPENLGNLCLYELEASRTVLSQLPSSVARWKQITDLKLAFCKLAEIPEYLCCVSSLVVLDVSGNNFENLPASMKQLSRLQHLYLSNCDKLQSLPELPLRLKDLEAFNCEQLRSLPELPSSLQEVNASDMKIVSDCITSYAQHGTNFMFINCHKLNENGDNILADEKQRFQYVATASLRYRHEKARKETHAITFFLPGSEIPNWVRYQSSGSSLTTELTQHWCNGRFIGFVLCAVIVFEESYDDDDLCVRCQYSFKINQGDGIGYKYCSRDFSLLWGKSHSIVSINSDHILLVYDPCFDARLLKADYTTASFEFRVHNQLSRNLVEVGKVKCCGVCPLYTEPNKAQPNISIDKFGNQDSRETIDDIDISGRERCDEEKEEDRLDYRWTSIVCFFCLISLTILIFFLFVVL